MRSWVEIDLEIVRQNLQVVKRQIGSQVGVLAVLKCNAYGHGIEQIATVLDSQGVTGFAVISLEEARKIRRVSQRPVLILGYLDIREVLEAIEEDFILSLYDKDLAVLYERAATKLGLKARVHLKVETGLNRLGFSVNDAADLLVSQHYFPHLRIEAVFSHLIDPKNHQSNAEQLARIQQLLVKIQGKTELLPIHFVSSGGLRDFGEGYFDDVRIGLAIYGVEQVLPGLEPVMSCKSVVMQVHPVEKGDYISYGRLYQAPSSGTVAVVAIGYGEGYTQALTGKAEVLIAGQRVKVVGKICMDYLMADVTGLSVKRGDEVVLVGQQKGPGGAEGSIAISELAEWSGLRHHELLIRFGQGSPRIYRSS